ncbi:YifB family Mg chelatase-like AAA ATPase [Adlercreutzia sp. ZJ154]|uniref:YifB family Mg chelatase-like AAA ATPase n=1 Tax=Adlercreutzia sp. ZJ154 TaxID=2709790 RepID=UPI0013EBA87D|nr:YifB family Mg chelatase-like AAA ATPase [Adlercreutzia sp. ZJ154]
MNSHCFLHSAVLRGVEAIPVCVEVSVGSGVVGISIVGMADTSVQEARERVRGAIKACGFAMPSAKIVVNLAPGNIKKNGSGFDLPIAIGILAASGQIDKEILRDKLFVGELSLDGSVRKVAGMLAFGICANKEGLDLVGSADEIVPIDNLNQYNIDGLWELTKSDPFRLSHYIKLGQNYIGDTSLDFKDVAGHEAAKRAAQIAVAGKHGLLMSGPPGSGKTMIASRISTIMPPLSEEEMLQAAAIHSVAEESIDAILRGRRPFRQPHHSATMAGLLGGGSPIRPGEVSLAHCGTLFLDELPEFKPSVLQGLRQPIESGKVCITRADGNVQFPANFMLIAAANPCPCGYFGDDSRECTCTIPQIRSYQARIGGPLLDRIDIQLDVRRIPSKSIFETNEGSDSASLREGVMQAQEFASWRKSREGIERCGANVSLSPQEVIASCCLRDEEKSFIEAVSEANSMSGRALISCLKVSRTIADLEQSESVKCEHLAEAFGFRVRSR